MDLAIAGLTFLAVTFAAWEVLRPKEDVVGRRVRGTRRVEEAAEPPPGAGWNERLIRPAAARIGRTLAAVPTTWIHRLERMLIMSDSELGLSQFVGLWAGSIVLGWLFFIYFTQPQLRLTPLQLVMVLVGLVLIFTLGPYVLLNRRVKKRQKAIIKGLPYAIDLLVTCVEAGLSLDAAVATLTEKTSGPIGETFAGYLREVGLGRSRRDALAEVAGRSGVADLNSLATNIARAEQMGVNIGDVLRVHARDLRLTHRQRVEAAAQRAPVLMTIPLATCFIPAMVAVTVVPAILHLLSFVNNLGRLPR